MPASVKQLHVLLGFMACASSTLQAHREASANTRVIIASLGLKSLRHSTSIHYLITLLIPERLSDFRVLISNTSFPVNSSQLATEPFRLCGQFPGIPLAAAISRLKCPGAIIGRYVYITLPGSEALTLCEVQLFGRKH